MGSLIKTIKNFLNYKDLLRELVSRDIKLKYRRSFLGYLWSVLNPLMIMVIMTIVFSTMFRGNIENFPVYLFTGQLLFSFMNQSTQQAIYSITGNGALLKKIYLPKYIFVFSKITSGLIDLIFSFGALVLVMIFTGAKFTPYCLLFPFVLIQLYVFCLGFGMFLAQANVFFRDVQYLYNAFITAWMYATPLFYPIEMLPGWLQFIVSHFNPMYLYIDQLRALVYRGTLPSAYTVVMGVVIAVAVLGIGSFCFKKNQDRFILYI
ncbi:MAG: ABC transporter permease [Lachnospiraceae bacterium]|nr:ABC transporter permease [Lachnospiraceae bacterium]